MNDSNPVYDFYPPGNIFLFSVVLNMPSCIGLGRQFLHFSHV